MSGPAIIRVMSFNLRVATAPDGDNAWDHRRDHVVDTIRAADPDLLGTQECLAIQADFLRSRFDDYGFVGIHREDGVRKGEASTILFKRSRFDLLDCGTFWLSESPEAVGVKGWDADLARVCSWAKLRDRESARELLFLNTHFDHRGEIARRESARQLSRWIEAKAVDPAILAGDFNADGGSEPYQILCNESLRDAWRAVHPSPVAEEGTFHDWTGTRTRERIDWILCSPHFDVLSCNIDYANRAGRWPSDHFPVTAEFRLQQ